MNILNRRAHKVGSRCGRGGPVQSPDEEVVAVVELNTIQIQNS